MVLVLVVGASWLRKQRGRNRKSSFDPENPTLHKHTYFTVESLHALLQESQRTLRVVVKNAWLHRRLGVVDGG